MNQSRGERKQRRRANRKLNQDARKYREYLAYQNIARHLAGKFAFEYRKPYEEVVAVAEYALALELFGRRGYRKKHGTKKSSWLYTVVYFHLTQVYTRGSHPCPRYDGSLQVNVLEWTPAIPFSVIKTEDMPQLDPYDQPSFLARLLPELGEDARALVKTILKAPAELEKVILPKKTRQTRTMWKVKEAVRAYLIDAKDWTNARVERAWEEVQDSLSGDFVVTEESK